MLDHEHRKVWFSGHVQGVGFRFTTHRIATQYDVSGYVQNLPDGRVLVEVEGSASEIERFLNEIADQLGKSPKWVHQNVYLARRELREILTQP